MIFSKHRFEIWNQNQHPLRHSLTDFAYTSSALPGVSTMQSAMDWVIAVLYPIPKAAVANPAALPSVGNTIGDYRVVTDDGDGKSAGYRWEQREGDAVAKWYKIYDMDFGAGSVLQQAMDNAQELFVQKFGNDDLDSAGAAVTGLYAGQVIYGGKTASKNLTLRANAGDGVGASTGYVQSDDNFRPTIDNTFTDGLATFRWSTIFGLNLNSGASTLSLISNSITGMTLSTAGKITLQASGSTQTVVANLAALQLTSASKDARIVGGSNDSYTQYQGGASTDTGAFIRCYGSAHATPNILQFYNAGTLSASSDASGNYTFVGTIAASNLSGTNSGNVSLAAVGSSPNANGASLSTQALTLQPADGTNPGLLTAGTQTIGGAKTFSGALAVANTLSIKGDGSNVGFSVSAANLITIGASGSAAQHILNGRFLDLQGNSVGVVGLLVTNNNNANAAAHACLELTTGGTGGGDPYIRFDAIGTDTWSIGADTSAGGNWRVCESTTLGANVYIDITAGTGQVSIKGTATNNNASAGFYGEYIESLVSSATSVGTTDQFFDLASISLTAGDWDISGTVRYAANGATFTSTDLYVGIGTATGNSGTGTVDGVNTSELKGVAPTTFLLASLTVPPYRVSLSATTTYYLKGIVGSYSVGTPKYLCRISARRVR